MEKDIKKNEGGIKTGRVIWFLNCAGSEVLEKSRWRVSRGGHTVSYIVCNLIYITHVVKIWDTLFFQFPIRYLILRFFHVNMVVKWMTDLMLMVLGKLMMLVSCIVRGLWNFLLISWASCQQGGTFALNFYSLFRLT